MLPGNVDDWPTPRRRGRVVVTVAALLVLVSGIGVGAYRLAATQAAPPSLVAPAPPAETPDPPLAARVPPPAPAPPLDANAPPLDANAPPGDANAPPLDALAPSLDEVPTPGAVPTPNEGGQPELNITGLLGNQPVSQNWAGYAATDGGYTAVSATWTLPDIAISIAAGTDATWVGIGGVRSRDLIQAGTDRAVTNSKTHLEAWIELLPQPSRPVPLELKPGDSIQVSITQQGPENWLIAFNNVTTGQSYQVTEHYASSLTSVEWVEEAPSVGRGRQLPLDDFGTLQFTAASAIHNDEVVNVVQSGAHAITMITPGGLSLVETSRLDTSGGSFSVRRTSVPSPAPRRRS
jgi:Peptidase A4 family